MLNYCEVFLRAAAIIFLGFAQYKALAQEGPGEARIKCIGLAARGDFPAAGECFRENLRLNAKDAPSISSLAVIQDLSDGKITPEYASVFFKGLDFLQQGDIESAIAQLNRAVEISGRYPRAYNILGLVYASLGDTLRAQEHFLKAVEIDPGYAEACFNLAALYQAMGKPNEALDYYKKVIRHKPADCDALKNSAALFSSLGQYQDAIAYYKKLSKILPDDPDVYYNLALAYFMSEEVVEFKNNLEKAQKFYQQRSDAQGLQKVEEYMAKIRKLDSKIKN